jgi:hypothetical protein
MTLGVHGTDGKLHPIQLRKVESCQNEYGAISRPFTVGRLPLKVSLQEYEDHMDEVVNMLNDFDEARADLEQKLHDVQEDNRSLREDLKIFSTFEQICNSGMLRNFKIDSSSDFAQVILRLLQRTMELQISHLGGTVDAPQPGPVQSSLPETGRDEATNGPLEPEDTVRTIPRDGG